ncbi:hypothetical protein K439DRAFT_1657635 [Ramaria rubella]|nr:hypothetical protein K439DRAFT_1657635 [Ramaria rubella]
MPTTSANVRYLNASRAQALQALQSVSERLGDILGDISGDGTRPDSGELVNEEGLPIIDITEPVDELDTPSLSAATEDEVIEEDHYPEPISKLTSEALAVSRRHRDKIFELLEEEEEREERRSRREHTLELEQKREAARAEMQRRMMSQGVDLEKRRRAKELERKMAKALISDLGRLDPAVPTTSTSFPQHKQTKSVTFADLPPSVGSKTPPKDEQRRGIDWGDVVPGRLPAKRNRLSNAQTQPMKMEVVERSLSDSRTKFMSTSLLSESSNLKDSLRDSDDESGSENASVSDSTVALEPDVDDVVLSAQRHRELALEYHRRRQALASNAGALHIDDTGLLNQGCQTVNWDQENVPIEATLAHSQSKPSISKFKASLPAATREKPFALPNEVSSGGTADSLPVILGTSVLPSDALAKSIKLGKLVDGNLTAGPEEEDEIDRETQEEEEIRKLLLKSMEEYSGIAAQVIGPSAGGSYWAKPEVAEAASSSGSTQIMIKEKPKASRFKVNRTQSKPPGVSGLLAHENSSPQMSTSGQLPPSPATVALSNNPMNAVDPPSLASSGNNPLSFNISTQTPLNQRQADTVHSMIIDSPSFMPPASTIIDSQSFRRTAGLSLPLSTRGSPTVIPTPSSRSVDRRSIVANNVQERSGERNTSAKKDTGETKPRRVSRFKAERS